MEAIIAITIYAALIFVIIRGLKTSYKKSEGHTIKELSEKLKSYDADIEDKINLIVSRLSKKGFVVVYRGERQVQLKKEKKFSWDIAILGLLFFIVGFFLYLLWYFTNREKFITYTFDSEGNLIDS